MPARYALTIVDDAKGDDLPLPPTLSKLQASVDELRTLAQPQPDPVLDLGTDVTKYATKLAQWCRECTDTKAVRAAADEMVAAHEAQLAAAVLDTANETWPAVLDERFAAALADFEAANAIAPANAPGLRDGEPARAAWLAVEEAAWLLDRLVTWRAHLAEMRGETRTIAQNVWIANGLPDFGNAPPVWPSESLARLVVSQQEWREISASPDSVLRWRWRVATGWPLRLARRGEVEQVEESLRRWYYDGAAGNDTTTGFQQMTTSARPGVDLPATAR